MPLSDQQRKLGLGLLLVLTVLIRLPQLSYPLVLAGDWSFSQLAIYARNYAELGWFQEFTIPCFGIINGRGLVYANHPWLSSILLGFWGWPFSYNEFSYRSLALLFSALTTLVVYLIGKQIDSPRTGLLAGALFSLAPLSIYMGRAYTMEGVHIAFLLLAYWRFLRWQETGKGLVWCLAPLILAQLSDIYALFFSFWVFLYWLRNFSRLKSATPAYFAIAVTPVLVQAGLMWVVSRRALGAHAWERGVSRIGQPWLDWVDPGYWGWTSGLIFWNYAYLLPVTALLGVVWWWRGAWPEPVKEGLGFLWFYPVLYTLLGTMWMKHHSHLVIFYGPVIALHGGVFLMRLGDKLRWSLLVVQIALAGFLSWTNYYQVIPLHVQELKRAAAFQEFVQEGDLLVGLPPHVAYYLNHKATVPYDFFLRSGDPTAAELNQVIRDLAGEGSYQRVLVFHRFIQWPESVKQLDLENLYGPGTAYRFAGASEEMYVYEAISDVDEASKGDSTVRSP